MYQNISTDKADSARIMGFGLVREKSRLTAMESLNPPIIADKAYTATRPARPPITARILVRMATSRGVISAPITVST